MNEALPEITTQSTEVFSKINELEDRLTKALGPSIWLYANVIDPKSLIQTISFQDLDLEKQQLVKEYIAVINILLEQFELDPVVIENNNARTELDNLLAAFTESTSLLYNLRLIKAIEQYADYQLLRVHTWLEHKMLEKDDRKNNPDTEITYTMYLPGTIKTTDFGAIDLNATRIAEEQSNAIKTYLSLYTEAKHATNDLLDVLLSRSSYSVVPRFFQDLFLELGTKVIMILMSEPVSNVYRYLDRGYTVGQAKTNVINYYKQLLLKNNEFPEDFKDVEKVIDELILKTLKTIPNLESKTITGLTIDIKNELMTLFATGLLYPTNYYQFDFRKADPGESEENQYKYVIDAYFYLENVLSNEYPVESYAITLTDEANTAIFEAVTNGQINPGYTLEDFLKFKKFDLES